MAAPAPLCKPAHRVDRQARRIELGPGEGHRHTASVLVLHGFGDTAAGWFEPAFWWAERLPHVRFVLPTAPVSAEMGTTAWFSFGGPNFKRSFAESVQALQAMLAVEEQAVGAGRVAVVGFSQGGALAYHLGLHPAAARLGGIAALSTFLRKESLEAFAEASKQTAVLVCHGTEDDRIPGGAQGAEKARGRLAAKGFGDVELKVYQGLGHAASEEELRDILQWLRRVLPEGDLAEPKARL